ncbi:MAG: UDP-2,4-diacetamido-2,4,6-trideoxy-beta-L-altropyranose hydrolase [Succinivibrio sp.]|nr:UDP-2,4-diacetamido-2,4,6-trideoxy-beta-L-altropyranose hydrolase [Succinivibrio sp.]
MQIVCVFKADEHIGTGHLMRVKGLLPYFAGDTLTLCTDSLSKELYPLCSEYEKIYEARPQALGALVHSLKPDLVLIDHYYLDERFEAPLCAQSVVAVIDDLFGPRRHHCHLLFDQGLSRTPSEYAPYVNDDCKILVGPEYSLVKPCFAQPREPKLPERPTVLINFGGADPKGSCLVTARSVRQAGLTARFNFVILAGQVNPQYDELQAEFGTLEGFEVIRHTGQMDSLLRRCQLAIGACGGSFLERICAGVPSLNVEIADNQAGAGRLFDTFKVALPYALEDLARPALLAKALTELCEKAPAFIQEGQALLDGQGLMRISEAIKARLKLFTPV